MAQKDWTKIKSKNPYVPHSWMNKGRGLLLTIHYDIGFGNQRNVSVYNYRKQLYSGYEHIKTFYLENQRQAMKKAMEYMENN